MCGCLDVETINNQECHGPHCSPEHITFFNSLGNCYLDWSENDSELLLHILFQWPKSCWNDVVWSSLRQSLVIAHKYQVWSCNDSSLQSYSMDRIAGSISPSPLKGGGRYGWPLYSQFVFYLKFTIISLTALKIG